jgi:hypothetical protein
MELASLLDVKGTNQNKIKDVPATTGLNSIYDVPAMPMEAEGRESEAPGKAPLWADLLIGAASYGGTAFVLNKLGVKDPVKTSAVAAPIYLATKKLLFGENPEPIILDKVPGLAELPKGVTGTAEEIALWTIPVHKVFGKAFRGLAKGVEKATAVPLTNVAEKTYAKGADWLWKKVSVVPNKIKIPVPEKISADRYGLKIKSLTEVVQPAIERIAKENPAIASTIRSAKVEEELTKEVGGKLGLVLEKENPKVVYEVGRALKNKGSLLNGVKDKRAKEILTGFNSDIKALDLNRKYENNFRKQLAKVMSAPQELSQKALKALDAPSGNTREIHKVLRGVIENPKTSEKVKEVAKDLWVLPTRTPQAAARASREAGMAFLKEKVKKMSGAVSARPGGAYVESTVKGLKGVNLHKDIELEFKAMEKLPEIANGLFQKYFMGPWKTNKVIMRPASHIRNLMSNTILNDWGGLPFYRTDVYIDALKGMKMNHGSWKEFKRLTGLTGTNYGVEDIKALTGGFNIDTSYKSNVLDKMLNVYDKNPVVAGMRSLYNAEESMFKYAKFLHNMERGMGKKEAAWDAIKWTMNFGEVTPEVATVGKYAIPFVRWFSKVIPLGAETMVKHPMRMGKWLAFGAALQNHAIDHAGMDDDEWDTLKGNLPDYMQKGLYMLMPFRDEKDRLQMVDMTYTIPFLGDISDLYQRSPAEAVIQNPIFTIPSALLSKDKYSGVPLYYDWEPAKTKFAKTMLYVWEQWNPSIAPGGTDWRRFQKAINEDEGALTVDQAIANFLGLKLSPIDPQANLRRKAAIRKIYDREIMTNLRKQIRNSKSEEETQKAIKKYQGYRREIRQ